MAARTRVVARPADPSRSGGGRAVPSAGGRQDGSGRRGLVYRALTSGIALAVVGGFGYYAWSAYVGEQASIDPDSPVVTVQASAEPLKTAPDDPGGLTLGNGDYAFFDEINGQRLEIRPDEESLLPPPEEPIADLVPEVFDRAPSVPVELFEVALGGESDVSNQPLLSTASEPVAAREGVSVPPALVAPMLPLPAIDQAQLTAQPAVQNSSLGDDAGILAETRLDGAGDRSTVAPDVPAASSNLGSATVQLASMRSQDLAEQEWTRLRRLLPDLLGNREGVIRESASGERVYFRVSVAAGNAIEAATLCAEIKNRNFDCIVHN